jgi:large subunit ribosomal protein L18
LGNFKSWAGPQFQLLNYEITRLPNSGNERESILIVERREFYEAKVENMIPEISKDRIRKRIHNRLRQRLEGTPERPRLNVYRSLNHIYAQVIDDSKGVTLAAASTAMGKKEGRRSGGNLASAREIGKLIAERAREKGIKKVVFDRGGYLYHGRIKALADAAREAGLEF